jgi:isoleucyl-tRNA synthetase
VHLSEWPQLAQDLQNQQLQEKWQRLLEIRAVVLKAIELQRERGVIGNSLEAEITLSLKEKSLYNFLDSCLPILKMIFIVSEVALKEAKELPPDDFISEAFAGLSVAVKKSSAQKCQRCWNYSSSVGESKDYPDLCNRCRAALKGGKHA